VKKDGGLIDVEITVHEFELEGKPCALAVALDVTERNRMEGQIRQAQKMEAIGNLAGGVAHDFNNILSIILSYSQMLVAGLKPGDPMREDLEEISGAGERAADLTRQLLAFSRQQILRPRILDLNGVIDGVAKMLRRLVGEDVELSVVDGGTSARSVPIPDRSSRSLMNLVVNARDAMPKGGQADHRNVECRARLRYAAGHADVVPGRYVMLAVTDTGAGMDASHARADLRAFLHHQGQGKGTGLGLSTVFGIVRAERRAHLGLQRAGPRARRSRYISRRAARTHASVVEAIAETRTRRGSETILLVEDEAPVRALARTILERHGYHVLEAQSGGDALLICEQHRAAIHVLLTDVVMPRMSGRKLAERLGSLRPEMKVLYMSGYTDDAVVRHGILDSDVAFLQKPITPETLTRKLREVIESRGAQSPDAASGTFSVTGSKQARSTQG
jgi:two-component system cell cycle sensor histidine kinase/response regulator CckA